MSKKLVLVLIGLIIGMVALSCVDTGETKSAEVSKMNNDNVIEFKMPEVVYIFNVSYGNVTYRCIYAEEWGVSAGTGGLWCERLEG